MDEPRPPEQAWPRYSSLPFPVYRYLPGYSPHPSRDPRGHAYGVESPVAPGGFDPARWFASADYLFGIDLFNYAYWWECHERLERPWRSAGRASPEGRFLQGLIQIAAAQLKRHLGAERAGCGLAARGLANLVDLANLADLAREQGVTCFGIDGRALTRDVRESFGLASSSERPSASGRPVLIRLAF